MGTLKRFAPLLTGLALTCFLATGCTSSQDGSDAGGSKGPSSKPTLQPSGG